MADAPVLGTDRRVDLDDEVFGARFNEPLVHECVVAELAAKRQGTAKTKTRGEVRGGGAKPWRQKGTGRARAGSIRSPLWAGGGTVFGPQPRRYLKKVNRKARRAALRSALSVHAARGSLGVLAATAIEAPSTKQAAGLLAGWDEPRPTLVLVEAAGEAAALKSFRNLERVRVLDAADAGIADVLAAASLVVSEAALTRLVERARGERVTEGVGA